MIVLLEEQQANLDKISEENRYWARVRFETHKWIEYSEGYYRCEFCNVHTTFQIAIGSQSMCTMNPNLIIDHYETRRNT